MHTVTSEIDVHLPVQTVYDQWTQFEDFPKFMSGVEEVRQIDDPIAQEKRRAASRAAFPTSVSAPQEAGGRLLSEP